MNKKASPTNIIMLLNGYARAVSIFYSWLVREGIIQENHFAKVKAPKSPKKVIAAFSESQLGFVNRFRNTSQFACQVSPQISPFFVYLYIMHDSVGSPSSLISSWVG